MEKTARRLCYKSILGRRGVLLLLLLLYLLFQSLNFWLYAEVYDAISLRRTLNSHPYTHVGISAARLSETDVFTVYDGLFLSKSVTVSGEGAVYHDRVAVVSLQELADATYTEVAPYGAGMTVEGEYARLASGEIAVSQKVAEAAGVTVGDTLYVSALGGPLCVRIRYVYRELYSVYDVNMAREVYSIILSAEDRFYAPEQTYLHYQGEDDLNMYFHIYLKQHELNGIGTRFLSYIALGSAAVVFLSCLAFWLMNRKARMKTAKMRSYGWGLSSILAVHAFRVAVPLLLSTGVICVCGAIAGLQPIFYVFVASQALVTFVAELWVCSH